MLKYIKKPILAYLGPAILIAAIFVFLGARQLSGERKQKVLMESAMRSLNYMHYAPVTIDDSFSARVFDNYLSAIDYNKKFLLEPDVETLKGFRETIDDDIRAGEFSFFEAVEKIIAQRIQDASSYYQVILANPFDFTVDEEIELDAKKNDWAATPVQLGDEWRKALKYQVMLRVHQDIEVQDDADKKKDTVLTRKTFREIEQAAREQVLKTHQDYFGRLLKLTRDDRFGMFLNAIGSVYDPHTNYFPPKLKDDFDIAMSGKLEGIGAVLTQRGGYIQVEEIMPGSPSWKQGDLKAGDLILKVAQGEAEPVDVTSMRLDDAVKLIRGKKGTEARLTIKKKVSDEIVVISIIRDVVEMEQTYARSAVIQARNGEKIGYLFLPKFYVDFNNPITGRSCSEDVRKEIRKLNAQGIDALVFDLRNNGGGSLQDVVKMSGYFIPRGPIVQVRDKLEGLEIMRDLDPSVLFDGPMAVMVNSGSASASEIMAAAMQDYRRAVIIGSPSTFGKGTVQRMLDLDAFVEPKDADLKPLGAMKLTTQKFYRINGGATQLQGVKPDIILPDPYTYIDFGEKDLDNAMEWSKMVPTNFDAWTGAFPNLDPLNKNSRKRIADNEEFAVIDEYASRLKVQRDQTRETLHLESYRQKQALRKKENERYNKVFENPRGFKVEMVIQDSELLGADTVKTRIMNEWIEGLRKDIYLEETTYIVTDMLEQKTLHKNKAKK